MEEFALALIASLVQAMVQQGINKSQVDYQNEYNQQMTEKYNTPKAQAEQLKAAGLSDAAIGQALSGYSGQSLTLTSAPMQPTNFGLSDMFGEFIKNKQTDSNVELQDEQKELVKVQAQHEAIKKGLTGLQKDLYERSFGWFLLGNEYEALNKVAENKNIEADTQVKEVEKTNIEADTQVKEVEKTNIEVDTAIKNVELEIKKFENQIKEQMNDLQIKLIQAQIKEKYGNIRVSAAQVTELFARAMYLKENGLLAKQTKEYNKYLEEQFKSNEKLNEFKNYITEKLGVPYDEVTHFIGWLVDVASEFVGMKGTPSVVKGFGK